MSNIPISENGARHGPFGVFAVDINGTVGDLFGMWHRTLPEAEQHLGQVRGHYGKNYIALSRVEHETRINEQQASGLVFKTGHDLLMDEFDQWLKENHLVRGVAAAALLGLIDKEFKSAVKKGLFKRQFMPNHDNLVGYPADLSLTQEQHEQFANEHTLNAHQVAEELGVTQKEFSEIKKRSDMAHSPELLGRTVPNDSGTASSYSRADIEKLRPAAEEIKAQRPKPSDDTNPTIKSQFPKAGNR